MPPLLCDTLGRLLSRGVFNVQGGLSRFYFPAALSPGQFTVFQHDIPGFFLRFPSLSVFNERKNPVRRINIKSFVRLNDFSRFLIHAVHRNVKMVVIGIIMQSVHGLMPGQPHVTQKNIHSLIHLFPRGLLPLLP